MGVPTLTLAGRTTASRVGAAILGPIGLGQFIAETEQEYIEKAVRFAAEPNELAALRQTGRGMISGDSELRAQMMTSSLDRAFRTVWQRWCDGTKATDLTMGDPAAVQTGVETAVRQLRQIH
jgi:predicted O-linked N-acetylglucosamine transferase (SPINDLY family)